MQVTQIITVATASQTITGFAPTTPVVLGTAAQTLSAVAGASNRQLVFSVPSGPCAQSAAILSYTGAGNCAVKVYQAADANYNAATQLAQNIVTSSSGLKVLDVPAQIVPTLSRWMLLLLALLLGAAALRMEAVRVRQQR